MEFLYHFLSLFTAKQEESVISTASDDLMEVVIRHLDPEVCKTGYYNSTYAPYLDEKVLCAGSIDGGVDTCMVCTL